MKSFVCYNLKNYGLYSNCFVNRETPDVKPSPFTFHEIMQHNKVNMTLENFKAVGYLQFYA